MEKNQTKKTKCYNYCLAIVLSLSTTIMTRVQFSGLGGMIENNYIARFGVSSAILFVLLFCVFSLGICYIDVSAKRFVARLALDEAETQSRKKIISIWAIVIVLAWIPYYLSYYPGGVYADTLASIQYVRDHYLTNRHPFFYTILIGLSMKVGDIFHKDYTWSIGFFTAMQMLVLECEFLYFVSWMLRHRVNRCIRIASSLFFVFFPLIPLYAISVWKDTPFCMAVLFWMMFVVDLYLEVMDEKTHIKTLVGFGTGMLLVAFTRNNGIYIVILSVLAMLIILFRRMREEKEYRIIMGGFVALVIMIYLIQGPLYNLVGIRQTEVVENFGIPLQQISAVAAYDGYITEEQKEVINKFIPYDNMKNGYSPTLVDNIKWAAGFDGEYFSTHIPEFLKLWLQLLKQNPSIYIRAYLMATLGFWDVDVASDYAYVQNFVWNNDMNIVMHDYFAEWFGFSFQHFANPRHIISSAWFFWIFFIATWFSTKYYGGRAVFLFIPQLGVWMTLMIATPIAVSLRYMAPNMFTLPFAMIVPLLLERRKGM